MYEPWIFAATLAAGGGLVAYSVALQPRYQDAPIKPEPPAAAVHVIPPAPPTSVPEPAPADTVLELEPVVIQARLHHAAAPPPTAETMPDTSVPDASRALSTGDRPQEVSTPTF